MFALKRSSEALLFAALTVACSDAGRSTEGEPPVLDPCGGPDHPCTLAGTDPAARARQDELAALVLERLRSPDDIEGAAEWLAQQRGVVSVATGAEGLRFRVRGGVGHWIFVQTAGTAAILSAPWFHLERHIPVPGSSPAEEPASTVLTADATIDNELARAQRSEDGHLKKALLLSPFRWQWEVEGKGGDDGIEEIAAALQARDYVDVTVWTERIDPQNPKRTIGEIGISAFTTWDDYDYVHLITHGGQACNPLGHCMTVVMTPWTETMITQARAGAEAARNDSLRLLIDRVGVETAHVQVVAPRERVPEVGPGQIYREDIPLTERDRPESEQRLHTLTGKFIVLTSQFFRDTYDGGIDNAVIVVSACSSGASGDLIDALRGENTAVVGWRRTMTLRAAAAAGTLLAKALVEVDEQIERDSGLTVGNAMQRIRERLDELSRDPPDHRTCDEPTDTRTQARCALASDAQILSVINDQVADAVTGASLVVAGDTSVRAREIVYLVSPAGTDLSPGSILPVSGIAGDGRPDTVDVRFRVDGLSMTADPQATRLRVRLEGREIEVDSRLRDQVADGVWELEHQLPLGRDHREGEVVDFEVFADLHAGQTSRWHYRNLRLTGSWYTYSASGDLNLNGSGPLSAFIGVRRPPVGECHLSIPLVAGGGAGNPRMADAEADKTLTLVALLPDGLQKGTYPVAPSFSGNPDANVGSAEGMAFRRLWNMSGSLQNLTRGAFHAELQANAKYGSDDRDDTFISRGGTVTVEEFNGSRVSVSFSIDLVQVSPEGDWVAELTPDVERMLAEGYPYGSEVARRAGREEIQRVRAGYAQNPPRRSTTVTGRFTHVIEGRMMMKDGKLPDFYACAPSAAEPSR